MLWNTITVYNKLDKYTIFNARNSAIIPQNELIESVSNKETSNHLIYLFLLAINKQFTMNASTSVAVKSSPRKSGKKKKGQGQMMDLEVSFIYYFSKTACI